MVRERKDALDRIMALVIDDGHWSSKASRAALRALRQLPPAEVASFEALLLTTIDEAELSVETGAWVPERFEISRP
jgi:hypothetical protein